MKLDTLKREVFTGNKNVQELQDDCNRVITLLKYCAKQKDLKSGINLHHDINRRRLLNENKFIGNTLVDMYVKCGALETAVEVLHGLPFQDVVSWNVLIAGYVQHGHSEEALEYFEQMQMNGISPNAVTFLTVLKVYGTIQAPEKGLEIHAHITREGLHNKNQFLGNALVDMYAKCGLLEKAEEVFGNLTYRTTATWNSLIGGYVYNGQSEEAWTCFEQLLSNGCFPDTVTFVSILKACGYIRASERGQEIYADIARLGYVERYIVVGNALIDMYAKCGDFEKAQEVFDELPAQDVITWNALLTGYANQGLPIEALNYFVSMKVRGYSPDAVTYLCILKVCSSIEFLWKGKQIHAQIARVGLIEKSPEIGNALVDMYAKCGELGKAKEVFDELPIRSVFLWNLLITRYTEHGYGKEALECFKDMEIRGPLPESITFLCILKTCASMGGTEILQEIHEKIERRGFTEKYPVVGNALVDAYSKCGNLTKARDVFDGLLVQSVASWNALITGYVQHGQYEEVLNCYDQMQYEELLPDPITLVCILNACSSMGEAKKGQVVHTKAVKEGLLENHVILGNALIDMYAKCGMLLDAEEVFDELPECDVVSWNTLIAGYVQHGHVEAVLTIFQNMELEGFNMDAVTFSCVLKSCSRICNLDKGQEIYAKIVKLGPLETNVVVGTALVHMYAKHGALVEATMVFDKLLVQNTVSWSALISGNAQQENYEEAFRGFERMQLMGLFPDMITIDCMVKVCGITSDLGRGQELHAKIVQESLLKIHTSLSAALVDMYAKCNVLSLAQQMFDSLSVRDVSTWNSLIGAYAQHTLDNEVSRFYERMKAEGVSTDKVTLICALKGYRSSNTTFKVRELHSTLLKECFLKKKSCTGNVSVNVDNEFGMLEMAQQVCDTNVIQEVTIWNMLIAAYAHNGNVNEAFNCMKLMQFDGITPDRVPFIHILGACSSSGDLDKGQEVHAELSRYGPLEKDLVLGNALVDMYVKCHSLEKAQEVFTDIPARDIISWNIIMMGYIEEAQGNQTLMRFKRMKLEGLSPDLVTFVCVFKACSSLGDYKMGREIHAQVLGGGLLQKDIILGNALVDMYAKCGALKEAQCAFDDLSIQNTVSWNALLSGYIQQGKSIEAIKCFEWMDLQGIYPDGITYISILKACGLTGSVIKGQQLYAEIVCKGLLEKMNSIHNSLMGMYIKFDMLSDVRDIFDKLLVKDVIAWNTMISGYAQHGHGEEALDLFELMQLNGPVSDPVTFICTLKACGIMVAVDKGQEMHSQVIENHFMKTDALVGTALVDMYVKCGMLDKGRELFNELSYKDVNTWNALIGGYIQHGFFEEAVDCFAQIQLSGVCADGVTCVCALRAFGSTGAVMKCQSIHNEILKRGLLDVSDTVGNTLVDTYVKCGMVLEAQCIFDMFPYRAAVLWNILISGYSLLGKEDIVFSLLSEMIAGGIKPTVVTFMILLNMCSHNGLLREGYIHLESMATVYNIVPTSEHYGCIIDLLSRAGQLEDAIELMVKMPFSANITLWNTVLGASQKWENTSVGKLAFEHAVQLNENYTAAYVCLSNIFSSDSGSKTYLGLDEVRRVPLK